MSRVVDFHSHVLCGVDHGSGSRAVSKAQIELMREFGTDIAVATSHFYPERNNVTDFLDAVKTAEEKISALDFNCDPFEICIGAEVLVCPGLNRMEGLEKLCIRGTKVILLEMPWACGWSHGIRDSVERIIDKGYTVVLAHIDRYMKKFENDIDYLLSAGALAQINAVAMDSFFSRQKMLSYVNSGCVYALGSDLHEADKKGYKLFASLEKKIGEEHFWEIMRKSEALLENAERLVISR